MRTALFTGAGASCALGYPLTSQLLPMVRAQLLNQSLFQGLCDGRKEAADRVALQGFLRKLYPGFDDSADQSLPLITEAFSLVEYALANGESLSVGGFGALQHFRDLLKQAITFLILDDGRKARGVSADVVQAQRQLAEGISNWFGQRSDSAALISTNYDISIESTLYRRLGEAEVTKRIDLGFDWRHVGDGRERSRPSSDPRLRVYKLHGSVNQLRCSSCGYVYFNPLGSISSLAFREELFDSNTCHCRQDVRLELHIVAPSHVREVRDANLLSVWRTALEWMRTADRWVIAGYSLPSEDLAIRSLLMRAYATAEKRPEVTVVQRGQESKARYELIFPKCDFRDDGLEGFLAREG